MSTETGHGATVTPGQADPWQVIRELRSSLLQGGQSAQFVRGQAIGILEAHGITWNAELPAAQEPQPAPDIEAAFASGARVRTGPCTVDAHDREHFQVRTNGHWLCGHLLASLLITQGIVANPEPQPAPELATIDLHRWYAVISQPDGTSKVIGHTDDGLGYYDSVDEWEAKNS